MGTPRYGYGTPTARLWGSVLLLAIALAGVQLLGTLVAMFLVGRDSRVLYWLFAAGFLEIGAALFLMAALRHPIGALLAFVLSISVVVDHLFTLTLSRDHLDLFGGTILAIRLLVSAGFSVAYGIVYLSLRAQQGLAAPAGKHIRRAVICGIPWLVLWFWLGFLFLIIVPELRTVFEDFEITLPWMTLLLFDISAAVTGFYEDSSMMYSVAAANILTHWLLCLAIGIALAGLFAGNDRSRIRLLSWVGWAALILALVLPAVMVGVPWLKMLESVNR